MKPIKVPERYNYVPAFLTLRCNLGCSYCINANGDLVRSRGELSTEQWIDVLNRLELREDLPITLEGGEPTTHPGFYDIIDNLKNGNRVDILTNLQFDVDKFIERVDPRRLFRGKSPAYKSIRASYHSERMDLEDTIKRATKLQDAGFKIGLFSLNLPESTESNMAMAEAARQNGIYFFIKDFLGEKEGKLYGHFMYPDGLDGKAKKVMCRNKELLIAPDARVYRCHRDLYAGESSIGSLLDEDFEIEDEFRPCDKYGLCNPCDIKLKTNRFLQMGSCSVEIQPEKYDKRS